MNFVGIIYQDDLDHKSTQQISRTVGLNTSKLNKHPFITMFNCKSDDILKHR